MQHALDVEVRIDALVGQEPIWVANSDEAHNRIFDAASNLFRDLLGARVQADRDRTDPTTFTQQLSIFALPIPEHGSRVSGDLSALEARLAADVAAKFGAGYQQPAVKLHPIPTFLSEIASSGGGAMSTQVPAQFVPIGQLNPYALPAPPPPPPPPPPDTFAVKGAGLAIGLVVMTALAFTSLFLGLRVQALQNMEVENQQLNAIKDERDAALTELKAADVRISNWEQYASDFQSVIELEAEIDEVKSSIRDYSLGAPTVGDPTIREGGNGFPLRRIEQIGDQPAWNTAYVREVQDYLRKLKELEIQARDYRTPASQRPRPSNSQVPLRN